MSVICPAILAVDEAQYRRQIENVVHHAHRIQIDLTDGLFASNSTIKPEQAWWPVGFKADFHLMYRQPLTVIGAIIDHKPNLVIVHAEAEGDLLGLAKACRDHQIKIGVALLQDTPAEKITAALEHVDHVLIFSGALGEYGGHANLSLLEKVKLLKQHKPDLEIGWDGGINDQNISELVTGGVDVLNVGGYIQNAADPAQAFATLQRIADETGTT